MTFLERVSVIIGQRHRLPRQWAGGSRTTGCDEAAVQGVGAGTGKRCPAAHPIGPTGVADQTCVDRPARHLCEDRDRKFYEWRDHNVMHLEETA